MVPAIVTVILDDVVNHMDVYSSTGLIKWDVFLAIFEMDTTPTTMVEKVKNTRLEYHR